MSGVLSSAVSGGLMGLMRVVAGVRARWLDAAPDGGQRIYVANHASHVDGLAVWAALPPQERARTRPVAAGAYWASSRLRRYVAQDVFDAVLIDRSSAHAALDAMGEALDAGASLILFPEGTRGDGATVGRFRAGFYPLVAERPSVAVVPVYLQNLSRVLPKGKTVPIPVLGHATFGAALSLEPGEEREAFVERVREAVLALRDA